MLAAACVNTAQPPGATPTTESAPSRVAAAIDSAPAPTATATQTPTPTVTPEPAAPPTSTPTLTPSPTTTPTLGERIASIRDGVVLIETSSGSGSGFFFDDEGHVLTNAHVVGDDTEVRVLIGGTTEVSGKVVGLNQPADLAVIEVSAPDDITVLELGDSESARTGNEAVALGYPIGADLGTDITVTKGIISSRRSYDDVPYLQIDAAINPGNSGGPLIDLQGTVIGINTFGLEGTEGLAFAIAVDHVKSTLDALTEGAFVRITPTAVAEYRLTEYEHPEDLWMIRHPVGWTVSGLDRNDERGYYSSEMIRFSSVAPEPASGLIVWRFLRQGKSFSTVKEWDRRIVADNRQYIEGYERISTEEIEIPDRRQAVLSVATTGDADDPDSYLVELTTIGRNDTYYVRLSASPQAWELFGDRFLEVVHSLGVTRVGL